MGVMWPKVAVFIAASLLMEMVGAQMPLVQVGGVFVGPGQRSSSTSTSTVSSSTSTPTSSPSSSSTTVTPTSSSTETSASTSTPSSSTSATSPSTTETSASTASSSAASSPSSTESTTVSTSESSSTSSSTASTSSSPSTTESSTVSSSVASSPSSTESSTISTSESSSTSSNTASTSSLTSTLSSSSTESSSSAPTSSSASSTVESTSSSSIQPSIASTNENRSLETSSLAENATSSEPLTMIVNISETESSHPSTMITNATEAEHSEPSTLLLTETETESSVPSTMITNATEAEHSEPSTLLLTATETEHSEPSTMITNATEAENISISTEASSTMEITTEFVTTTGKLELTSASENGSIRAETVRPGGHPAVLSDYDCSGVEPGYYGNPKVPCDTKFYICVDRSMFAYEQRCPAKLYYDADLKMCDMWLHIPACSGKSRPPAVNETEFTLSPVPPVIDCYNVSDGNYPDPESKPKPYCSNRFFTCAGRREFRFFCPRGTFYDHERNQCDLYGRVFVCSGNRVSNETDGHWPSQPTLPPVNFDCRGKRDGYYGDKCDSVYYSCNGGLARQFRCPDSLVFDGEWLSCESPHDTLVCSGTRRPSTVRPPSTVSHSVEITTASPLNCQSLNDGIYRDPLVKCSRIFYYCAHNVTFRNLCPGNLYFDDEFKRCDLWINVFDCSGIRPTTTLKPPSTVGVSVLPAVDFDCTRIEDGNYVNPKNKCSHFFYICANMESFQQYCPAGLYYNPDMNNCDSWANIFACSGITQKPTVATLPTTKGSTEKPEFDCSMKSDGVYTNAVNACSGVYFRCSGSITFKFHCPGGLFYDTTVDQCDQYDYVFACSGLTRPPTTSPASTSSPKSTEKPPIDCRTLADGDYADPSAKNKCSHFFYTCSSGVALRRECADGTYYDADLRACDVYWNIPACTGKPRPSTEVPTTRRSTGPPPPFDCTKRYDGNYAAGNCTGAFWSCVGGTTFPRHCPMGFIYDDEFDDCEFPHMVPQCGGSRITVPSTIISSSTTPPGGFQCNFLQDGNYADPANVCSTFYYTCANGMTTRVHCQAGLYYDVKGNLCNSHDQVPACNGGISAQNSTMAESTSTSTVVPSTISSAMNTSVSESSSTTTSVPSSSSSSSSVSSIASETTTTAAITTTEMILNLTSPTEAISTESSSSSTSASTESSSTSTTSESSSTTTASTSISTTELVHNLTEAITETTTVAVETTTVTEVQNTTTTEASTSTSQSTSIASTEASTLSSTELLNTTASSEATVAILGLTTESTQSPKINTTTSEEGLTFSIHYR